jgi:hypothetical protein
MKVKFLLLALVVALVACNKDDDDDNNPSGGVDYLKVGNEWVYELEATTSGFTMTGEFGYEVIAENSDGTYTVEQTTEMSGIPPQTETLYWTEDDVFNIGHDMSDVSVGDSWDETDEGVTYTTTVVAVNESLTVPAGTFSCTKLKSTQSDDDTLESFSYFNDSYGMIQMETTSQEEEGGVVVTFEMTMKLSSKNF